MHVFCNFLGGRRRVVVEKAGSSWGPLGLCMATSTAPALGFKCGSVIPVTTLSGGGNVWDLGEISPALGKSKALQRAHGKEERCISRDGKDGKSQSTKRGKKNENADSGKQREKPKLRKG